MNSVQSGEVPQKSSMIAVKSLVDGAKTPISHREIPERRERGFSFAWFAWFAVKAAEGRRSPRRYRARRRHDEREMSWSAPVLWRFGAASQSADTLEWTTSGDGSSRVNLQFFRKSA